MPTAVHIPSRLSELTNDLSLSGVSAGDLASTTDVAKGPALVGYKLLTPDGSGFVSGATAQTVASSLARQPICPEQFGAVGGGSIDDTTAVQNAANAAIAANRSLYLPQRYKITTSITIGPSSGSYFLNIFGEGAQRSGLIWAGADSGIALSLSNLGYSRLSDFGITNTLSGRGTTEGVRSAGTGAGTNTYDLVVQNLFLDNFHYGWHTSDGVTACSSELTFINLALVRCDEGFRNDSFNALDMNFFQLQMASCAIGLNGYTASCYVYGGSASGNDTDFRFQNGGTFTIRGYRSESATTRFLFYAGAEPTGLTVDGCQVTAVGATPPVAIELQSAGGVAITNSVLAGRIWANGFFGRLTLSGNAIQDTQAVLEGGGTGGDRNCWGNIQIDAGGTLVGSFPDEHGVWTNFGTYLTERSFVYRSPLVANRPVATRRNLMCAASLSATPTQGNNLRGSATFASAATAAVLFKRTVTGVSTTAGDLRFAHTGGFTMDDVGKSLVIAGAGTAGADLSTVIVARDDSLNLIYLADAVVTTVVAASATIGSDEPDLSFFLHLAGSANESFWWSGKASTGFTLHSSNASSAATVDWLLTR